MEMPYIRFDYQFTFGGSVSKLTKGTLVIITQRRS